MSPVSTDTSPMLGRRLRVRGQVQGVGFRPHVWRLARALGLGGRVMNDNAGVVIELWGSETGLQSFMESLRSQVPPLARIDVIERDALNGPPVSGFRIAGSVAGRPQTGVVPDTAACAACVAESLDPFSRRFRYPFTNCTHCGPRFSITNAIPYDRETTTMACFDMCGECAREYGRPQDRRYHAQAIACHACGPAVTLESSGRGRCFFQGAPGQLDAIEGARTVLEQGGILAIKGTGGFHIACDASNADAVDRLRQRKRRQRKPFALMVPDLDIARYYWQLDTASADLLRDKAAPIVLLPARADRPLPQCIAPGLGYHGVMLPYLPLHHLLLRNLERPIVMTSGNISQEPQCTEDDEARRKLARLVDYFLWHDRGIAARIDDSVVRVIAGRPLKLRRARGYAPEPLVLPPGFERTPGVLGMGSEIKNTFCFIHEGQAMLSQHIGDLGYAAVYEDYRRNLDRFRTIFGCREQVIAVDAHPQYQATRHGRELGGARIPVETVQHHHAHIAACLADNGVELNAGPVLGIAFDGMGYGDDGAQWGGEFLIADYREFTRAGALQPVRLPGGDRAAREPWRCLYAYLRETGNWELVRKARGRAGPVGLLADFLASRPIETLDAMMSSALNATPSSSCGRLFDAVAAAVGICLDAMDYEGEAAMRLESVAVPTGDGEAYTFAVGSGSDGLCLIQSRPMWPELLGDLDSGRCQGTISGRFHRGLGRAIVMAGAGIARRHGIERIVLTGGVFQNRMLFESVESGLRGHGLQVLSHSRVPANDGGLSLGQAVVAAARRS